LFDRASAAMQERVMSFRFAPSPNGHLHLGHAYSALLNARMARDAGQRFLIRIEDIDTTRCTPELTAEALEDLEWLGLISEAPVRHQSQHLADYREALVKLPTFPCFCTRKTVEAASEDKDPEGQPIYPGTCRALSADEVQARIGETHALRLKTREALESCANRLFYFEGGEWIRARPEFWGDVVIARKDIGTSYHLAVVVDDALQEITHVVRGEDLRAATSVHRLLQALLDLPVPVYTHHKLIGDEAGRKLSKSAGSNSLRNLRAEGVAAAQIRQSLGFG
jgi:glutamyl-Q tRNA(Asp) synthetase